jgi:hypothetical protein
MPAGPISSRPKPLPLKVPARRLKSVDLALPPAPGGIVARGNAPTAAQMNAQARKNMAGFDQMPKSLRLFLHEYGGMMPQNQVNAIIHTLQHGVGVRVNTPDGKVFELVPDEAAWKRTLSPSV